MKSNNFKFLVNGDGGVNKAYFTVDTTPLFVVNWGDGTSSTYDSFESEANLHTYATSGEYVITITSYQRGFIRANDTWLEIITPFPAMDGDATSFAGYFTSASYLRKCCGKIFINNPYITNLSALFAGLQNISEFPSDLFDGCVNVEKLTMTFTQSSIASVPSKFFSYCPKAKNFERCFERCGKLTLLAEDAFEGCVDAETFSQCFSQTGITSLKGSYFKDCKSATTFYQCFYQCQKLVSIEGDIFKDCISATNFSMCFYGCVSLVSIRGNLFENCVSASDFYQCFYGNTSLQEATGALFKNCSNTRVFDSVFLNCTALAVISENIFEGCTSGENFGQCFYRCALRLIPLNMFDSCMNANNFNLTFNSCVNLTGKAPELWLRANPTLTGTACFYGCTGLSNYDDIPSNWK